MRGESQEVTPTALPEIGETYRAAPFAVTPSWSLYVQSRHRCPDSRKSDPGVERT